MFVESRATLTETHCRYFLQAGHVGIGSVINQTQLRLDTEIVAQSVPDRKFFRPELDALRLFAFLSVYLYHCSYLPQNRGGTLKQALVYSGAFGMCLFFFLSSYLITTLLVKEFAKTGTINVPFFYARRVLRIWPLYFAFLAFCYLVLGRIYPFYAPTWKSLLAFVLLAGNWWAMIGPVASPIFPLWSISLEEQFYLFWPTLFKRLSRKNFERMAWLTIPVSLVSVAVLRYAGAPWWVIWWNTLGQVQFFGMGAVLALHGDWMPSAISARKRGLCFMLGIAAWMVGGLANYVDGGLAPVALSFSYAFALVGVLLLFRSFFGAKNIPQCILYFGKISFGLYVLHQIALDLTSLAWNHYLPSASRMPICAIALLATATLAHLSFTYFEKPFLRYKQHFTVIATR